jgi:hypothetical protein
MEIEKAKVHSSPTQGKKARMHVKHSHPCNHDAMTTHMLMIAQGWDLSSVYVAPSHTRRFFLSEERSIKAVLFTRKPEIPTLWRQVHYLHMCPILATCACAKVAVLTLADVGVNLNTQVAAAKAREAAFAVVKQTETDLLARFQLTPASLPKVDMTFLPLPLALALALALALGPPPLHLPWH